MYASSLFGRKGTCRAKAGGEAMLLGQAGVFCLVYCVS